MEAQPHGEAYRLIGVGAADLRPGAEADAYDLIEGDHAREKAREKAIDDVREKFGVNAVQRGVAFKPAAARERPRMIDGLGGLRIGSTTSPLAWGADKVDDRGARRKALKAKMPFQAAEARPTEVQGGRHAEGLRCKQGLKRRSGNHKSLRDW